MAQRRFAEHGMRSVVLAAVLAASVGASAGQSTPPAVPAAAGTASGTVQAGTLKITLAHAYASGPIGADDVVYQIVLTDAPLPDAAIAREVQPRGGLSLLRAGKVSGISLLVDASGGVRNVMPFIGSDLRGSQMLASAGTLPSFTVRDGRVTGQGQLTAEETQKQGWSYSASWNATLRPPAK